MTFMQMVALGDHLHDIPESIFWKKKNTFKMSSAESLLYTAC